MCRPAMSRMWLIIRVVVLLPFVPLIEMIGIRRSASRIQAGGVAVAVLDPGRPASEQAGLAAGQAGGPGRRDVALDQAEGGLRDRPGPAGRASTERSRSSGPGSDERWTARPARPWPWSTRRRRSQARQRRRRRPASPGRGPRWPEPDQGVAGRVPLAVPGPSPADGHLDLDHRLEPVDVGALEQADLDQVARCRGV